LLKVKLVSTGLHPQFVHKRVPFDHLELLLNDPQVKVIRDMLSAYLEDPDKTRYGTVLTLDFDEHYWQLEKE